MFSVRVCLFLYCTNTVALPLLINFTSNSFVENQLEKILGYRDISQPKDVKDMPVFHKDAHSLASLKDKIHLLKTVHVFGRHVPPFAKTSCLYVLDIFDVVSALKYMFFNSRKDNTKRHTPVYPLKLLTLTFSQASESPRATDLRRRTFFFFQ